jgi:hypothetical protein
MEHIILYGNAKLGPCDFIVIESLTNLGLTQRSLRLTPENWASNKKEIVFLLPPSPRGGMTPRIRYL